jgi:hypothetical protein
VVIGGSPEYLDPVKRSLHQIEWLTENFARQIFARLFVFLSRRKFAETETGFARLANHLNRPIIPGKEREAHNLLPFNYPLNRRFAGVSRNDAT